MAADPASMTTSIDHTLNEIYSRTSSIGSSRRHCRTRFSKWGLHRRWTHRYGDPHHFDALHPASPLQHCELVLDGLSVSSQDATSSSLLESFMSEFFASRKCRRRSSSTASEQR